MMRRETEQAILLDQYRAMRRENPAAEPPAGLDPELAATARRLLADLAPQDPAPEFLAGLRRRLAEAGEAATPRGQRGARTGRGGGTGRFVERLQSGRLLPVALAAMFVLVAGIGALVVAGQRGGLEGVTSGGGDGVTVSSVDEAGGVEVRITDVQTSPEGTVLQLTMVIPGLLPGDVRFVVAPSDLLISPDIHVDVGSAETRRVDEQTIAIRLRGDPLPADAKQLTLELSHVTLRVPEGSGFTGTPNLQFEGPWRVGVAIER